MGKIRTAQVQKRTEKGIFYITSAFLEHLHNRMTMGIPFRHVMSQKENSIFSIKYGLGSFPILVRPFRTCAIPRPSYLGIYSLRNIFLSPQLLHQTYAKQALCETLPMDFALRQLERTKGERENAVWYNSTQYCIHSGWSPPAIIGKRRIDRWYVKLSCPVSIDFGRKPNRSVANVMRN